MQKIYHIFGGPQLPRSGRQALPGHKKRLRFTQPFSWELK